MDVQDVMALVSGGVLVVMVVTLFMVGIIILIRGVITGLERRDAAKRTAMRRYGISDKPTVRASRDVC